jgi:hypothetical protein
MTWWRSVFTYLVLIAAVPLGGCLGADARESRAVHGNWAGDRHRLCPVEVAESRSGPYPHTFGAVVEDVDRTQSVSPIPPQQRSLWGEVF